MKRNLLATLMLIAATSAWATDRENEGHRSNGAAYSTSQSAAVGLGGSGVGYGGSSTVGGQTVSVIEDHDYPHIPVSSAIAPSVTSNVVCPIVTPSSKAGSVWFASASGTTGTTLNAICVAFHLNQPAVVEKMACNASKEYYEANCTCSDSCMPPETK